MKIKLHPLTAKGKYYVNENTCFACDVCNYTAPNNFKFDDGESFSSYVFKQPETSEEEAQCREALEACPHEAIYDDGDNL